MYLSACSVLNKISKHYHKKIIKEKAFHTCCIIYTVVTISRLNYIDYKLALILVSSMVALTSVKRGVVEAGNVLSSVTNLKPTSVRQDGGGDSFEQYLA